MKIFLGFCFLVSVTNTIGYAQNNKDTFANSITKNNLQKHLSMIASQEMEGRETGTEGQRKAAAYIANQFKQLGLLPAPRTTNYQQFFGVGTDSVLSSQLIINGKFLNFGKDYVNEVALNNNTATKANEVVFVGYGIEDKNYNDYTRKKVKGKIVLFVPGEPKKEGKYLLSGNDNMSEWSYPESLLKKARLAKEKGAVAAMVINTGMDTLSIAYTTLAKKSAVRLIKNTDNAVNCIIIPKNQARSLLEMAFVETMFVKARNNEPLNKEKYSKKLNVQYKYAEQKITTDASNVVGYIEGTDKKDEFVVLSAHYDHLGKKEDKIYYGADDDGSGTCAVLAMAEAFTKAKAVGNGPRRSVVFMTVAGEEEGLWGSEYYSDDPLFPLEKTSVDLNTDMVGRIDPKRIQGDSNNYIYVVGDDKISTELKPISEFINKKTSQLELDYKYNAPKDPERIYYRSDHYNFAKKGVPIIFYFNGTHNDYHQSTDTIEKINWELYQKRVRFIFNTAVEMANRERMIKRDIPLL
jgi:hypothetical protein